MRPSCVPWALTSAGQPSTTSIFRQVKQTGNGVERGSADQVASPFVMNPTTQAAGTRTITPSEIAKNHQITLLAGPSTMDNISAETALCEYSSDFAPAEHHIKCREVIRWFQEHKTYTRHRRCGPSRQRENRRYSTPIDSETAVTLRMG